MIQEPQAQELERSGLPFIGRVRYLDESYVRRVIPDLRSLELRQTDVSVDSVNWPYVRRAETIFHSCRRRRRLAVAIAR